MNVEALQQMIRVLEQVENDPKLSTSFNLDNWTENAASPKWTNALSNIAEGNADASLQVVADCGTSACACGFAALDPWFRQRGLRFELDGHDSEIHLYDKDGEFLFHGWWAIKSFFAISMRTAEHLFSSRQYEAGAQDPALILPRMVIERIQALLTKNTEEE